MAYHLATLVVGDVPPQAIAVEPAAEILVVPRGDPERVLDPLHLTRGPRGEHLAAFESPLIQVDAHPAGHVHDVRVYGCRRRDTVHVVVLDRA